MTLIPPNSGCSTAKTERFIIWNVRNLGGVGLCWWAVFVVVAGTGNMKNVSTHVNRLVQSAVARTVVQTWQSELALGKWRNKKAFECGTSSHASVQAKVVVVSKAKLVPIQPQRTLGLLSECDSPIRGRPRIPESRIVGLIFQTSLSPIPSKIPGVSG